MELNNASLSILLDFGNVLIILFAIALLWQKGKSHFRWAIVCLLSLLLFIIPKFGHYFQIPIHIFIGGPSAQLLFPLALYMYTRQVLGKVPFSRQHLLLHFSPFLFFYILFLFSPPPLPRFLMDTSTPPPIGSAIKGFGLQVCVLATYIGYLTAIVFLLQQHRKTYTNFYAQRDTYTSLTWMRWMVVIVAIGLVLITIIRMPGVFQFKNIPFWLVSFSMLLTIVIFSFFLLTQPMLYEGLEIQEEVKTIESESINITTESLNKEERALITKLEAYMEHEKAYLQPKIKIADIANILNERAHQLSKVINQHYGMNFFHFVNRYRVEYAMTLLAAPENAKLTIEGIGLQAGFSTRATFNSRFKEYTGKSPGVYMKEIQD